MYLSHNASSPPNDPARVERLIADLHTHVHGERYDGTDWMQCLIGQLGQRIRRLAPDFDHGTECDTVARYYDIGGNAVEAIFGIAFYPALRTDLEYALEVADWMLRRSTRQPYSCDALRHVAGEHFGLDDGGTTVSLVGAPS